MLRAGSMLSRVRIPQAQFGRYLRTGLWVQPDASAANVEVKFNPWHDPATGRFTFKGGGGGSGGGGGASGSWDRGGFTGGGGGSFGGGGASGDWDRRTPTRSSTPTPAKLPTPPLTTSAAHAIVASQASGPQAHIIVRNGYTYKLDTENRTIEVTGTLTSALDRKRSRAAQAGAGGTDRLSTDDGGHYVAVRFNGPTDSFNHFAQNANFNRGGYRVLEDEWASDIKQGKTVWVKIVPTYTGSSQRPSSIRVSFTVDGAPEEYNFPNSPEGKHHGK